MIVISTDNDRNAGLTWCRVKLPLARNSRPHMGHMNGRSPVWVRMWMSKLLLDFICRPHSEHRYCFRGRFGLASKTPGNFVLKASDDVDGPFSETLLLASSDCCAMSFADTLFFFPATDTDLLSPASSKDFVFFFRVRALRFSGCFFFEIFDLEMVIFISIFAFASEDVATLFDVSASCRSSANKYILQES